MLIWPGVRRNVGGGAAQAIRNAPFWAPLKTSLVLARGTGSPTFTRATVGTVMGYAADAEAGASQVLLTCASGEARHQGARRVSEGVWSAALADGTPIPDATLQGYLAEGARTNLCLQSQDFTTTWAVSNAAINANATTAPDGTSTADRLIDNGAGGSGVVQVFVGQTAASGANALSVYMEADQLSWGSISTGAFDATANGVTTFDLAAGAVGTKSANHTAAGVETGIDGRHRCWITFSTTVDLAGEISFRPENGTAAGTVDLDGTSSIYIWGAQLEAGAFPSTYIPTTTAAVTRNADVLTYPSAGNVDATKGTCYCEFVPSGFDTGMPHIRLISLNGNSGAAVLMYDSNTPSIYDGTTFEDNVAAGDVVVGTEAKIASSWGAEGMLAGLNGTLGIAKAFDGSMGSNGVIGINSLNPPLAGTIKNLRIWQRQLPDAVLQAITL